MNRFVKDLLAERWVEIVRTGKFNASTGKVTITQEHLQQMADDYDPEYRRAALVIGHPSLLEVEGERKAHGIVAGLRVLGNALQARFKNLSDEVREGLKAGHWINRSIEATLKSPETERAYLFALALLGGSQPAVPAMLSADTDSITIQTEIEDSTTQPPKEKGVSSVDEAQVKAQIEAAIKPLHEKIAELSARPNVSKDEFTAMQQQVAKVDQLLKDNETLKASNQALVDVAASTAVEAATAGIPAALCSDEEKAYLAKVYKDDQKAFVLLTAKYEPMRKKFAYLSTEVIKRAGGMVSEDSRFADARFSLDSREIHERALELQKADNNLSYDDAVIRANKEIK